MCRNLWRYAQNRARNLFYDRDADVERLMNPHPENDTSGTATATAAVAAAIQLRIRNKFAGPNFEDGELP